jgi:hypothetical protein
MEGQVSQVSAGFQSFERVGSPKADVGDQMLRAEVKT